MVKKRSRPKPQRDEKVPVQIRFDPELHALVTKAAESLDVSANQLVNAVLWGTIPRLIPGEAVIKTIDGRDFVNSEPRRKVRVLREGWFVQGISGGTALQGVCWSAA